MHPVSLKPLLSAGQLGLTLLKEDNVILAGSKLPASGGEIKISLSGQIIAIFH